MINISVKGTNYLKNENLVIIYFVISNLYDLLSLEHKHVLDPIDFHIVDKNNQNTLFCVPKKVWKDVRIWNMTI